VMEGAYSAPGVRGRQRLRTSVEPEGVSLKLDFTDPSQVKKEIGNLESLMYEQAKNLAFEEAAATRDRIAELKNKLLKQ